MEEEKKGPGFVVRDKRLFDEAGERRPEASEEIKVTPEKPQPEKPQMEKQESKQQAEQQKPPELADQEHFPEVNFVNFILSLSTSAMFHFGDIPDPATGQPEKNLSAAKQTIDILSMLKTKTQGNLDSQEQSLLDGMLYELRMRYVKEMGG
ncbi:MAG: DUF1844 domain-containing protein [Syntrophales bacterium]|jgi:hypothetical protein